LDRTVLQCDRITKQFGGHVVLGDVKCVFASNKITAIVGPNGAGKSTLFHVIAGVLRPENGEVIFRGRKITAWQPFAISRAGIGRLF
jgi:branched-chain amino acid transport system permease protein